MSIGFRLELVNKKHFLPDKELLMLSDKGTGGFMEHTDDRGYTYFQLSIAGIFESYFVIYLMRM